MYVIHDYLSMAPLEVMPFDNNSLRLAGKHTKKLAPFWMTLSL